MKVLIACEFSGIVRDAFKERGHDAWSCDLLPTERPGQHIQGDVLEILNDGWDLMIAHPPCTYLCNSGVSWLYKKTGRWEQLQEAAFFFIILLKAEIPKIAVENPIMHKYALDIIGEKPNQIIQPWMFGHGETKATCLWLKELKPLQRTPRKNDLFCKPEPKERIQRLHRLPPSPHRWRERSRTYKNIAKAMAEQWS
jgi:hypothetical protein